MHYYLYWFSEKPQMPKGHNTGAPEKACIPGFLPKPKITLHEQGGPGLWKIQGMQPVQGLCLAIQWLPPIKIETSEIKIQRRQSFTQNISSTNRCKVSAHPFWVPIVAKFQPTHFGYQSLQSFAPPILGTNRCTVYAHPFLIANAKGSQHRCP